MTIYTDQVTGKQYDRMPGGVASVSKPPRELPEGYVACCECAFGGSGEHGGCGEECDRASKHCVSKAPSKTVFFVFKERKA